MKMQNSTTDTNNVESKGTPILNKLTPTQHPKNGSSLEVQDETNIQQQEPLMPENQDEAENTNERSSNKPNTVEITKL